MSTITQSPVNTQYPTNATTLNTTTSQVGAGETATAATVKTKKGHPAKPHGGAKKGTGSAAQLQAQQKFFQQIIEMMTSFMQDTIKKLTEMFQGMVDPSTAGSTSTSNGEASSTDSTSGTGSASGSTEASTAGTSGTDSTSGSTSTNSTTSSGRSLEAAVDDQGCVTVLTQDGYKIQCEGKDQAWTITHPDGQVTRIWGDPHVHESDGDNWDFKERSTFKFGNNKVTVETVPAPNGQTYSSTISVYNGEERVTISGLDQNKPKLEAVGADGKLHDSQHSDGDTYSLGQESNGQEQWAKDGVAVAATSVDVQPAPTAAN